MAKLTDETIMEQVKAGQLSRLSVLFERYGVLLYNFFLKLTGDKSASEDLAQTVFYRILRYRHTFRATEEGFRPWMYRTARNLHADHCRQKTKLSLILIGSPDYRDEAEPPATTGYEEEQYQQLQTALSRLGAVDRELIVLSRYEGLKYADIARIKNTTTGAVKVQVHRAIKQLRLLYFNKQ